MALEVQDDLSPCSLADHTPSVLIPSPVQSRSATGFRAAFPLAKDVSTSGPLHLKFTLLDISSLSLCSALNLPSLQASLR